VTLQKEMATAKKRKEKKRRKKENYPK